MKLITAFNFLLSIIAFSLILGFANDPLMVGISILYFASATAFLAFGFNKKYSAGKTKGKTLVAYANATLLLSIIAGAIGYMVGLFPKMRIIIISTIIFIGGCLLLLKLYKASKSE